MCGVIAIRSMYSKVPNNQATLLYMCMVLWIFFDWSAVICFRLRNSHKAGNKRSHQKFNSFLHQSRYCSHFLNFVFSSKIPNINKRRTYRVIGWKNFRKVKIVIASEYRVQRKARKNLDVLGFRASLAII